MSEGFGWSGHTNFFAMQFGETRCIEPLRSYSSDEITYDETDNRTPQKITLPIPSDQTYRKRERKT